MINQRQQAIILGGKVSVKAFSWNIQLTAQVSQCNLIIRLFLHGSKQSQFQYPLKLRGFLGMTYLIHALPSLTFLFSANTLLIVSGKNDEKIQTQSINAIDLKNIELLHILLPPKKIPYTIYNFEKMILSQKISLFFKQKRRIYKMFTFQKLKMAFFILFLLTICF
jgi:hypothetical protein